MIRVRHRTGLHSVVTWLIVGVMLLNLTACQPSTPTVPSPTSEPPPPTNTAIAPTATVWATPTPDWQFAGDVAHSPFSCSAPPGEFVLGLDPNTCERLRGGSATIAVAVPPAQNAQVLTIRILCEGSAGCTQAVSLPDCPLGDCLNQTISKAFTVSVNGQTLWQANSAPRCNNQGCATAIGETLTLGYVVHQPSESPTLQVTLDAQPNVSWSIKSVQFEWRDLPTIIQGVAYSPFRDCQNPSWGPFPDEARVREDLLQVLHIGNAIRTYSTLDIQARIPELAQQIGFRVAAGAWLGRDPAINRQEIDNLIAISQQVKLESLIVGNEVLLRNDLSEDELIAQIEWVRQVTHDVPVTSAEIGGVLLGHPKLMAAVDYYLVHLYAYWDGIPIEKAARYVVDEYHKIQTQAKGKRVVIGETGWPAAGPINGQAVPSLENQRRFLREFVALAQAENVEFYYFAAFDELWKTEGGVGPYWGMFYADRTNKFDVQSVLASLPNVAASGSALPSSTSTPGAGGGTGATFPIYTTYAAETNHFAPSGFMGDLESISFNDCVPLNGAWDNRIIQISYTPGLNDLNRWAGIYWQEPENNWGNLQGGFDWRPYTQLHFRARSDRPNAQVQFLAGGIDTGDYPSSILNPIYSQEADADGFVTLTTEWQDYHIDLRSADLSHVIDGFGWVADQAHTPAGVTIYLDDILVDQGLPPITATPTQIPIPATAPPLPTAPTVTGRAIYSGQTLSPGFDMGVDTSGAQRNWVTDQGGSICMNYPPGQSWGAVFITVGVPTPVGQRPGLDLSAYNTLSVDLKGGQGGERLSIGLKDKDDPDNGLESKYPLVLTENWQTYVFSLTAFGSADLSKIYVPIEFVFEPGVGAETACFRNAVYSQR